MLFFRTRSCGNRQFHSRCTRKDSHAGGSPAFSSSGRSRTHPQLCLTVQGAAAPQRGNSAAPRTSRGTELLGEGRGSLLEWAQPMRFPVPAPTGMEPALTAPSNVQCHECGQCCWKQPPRAWMSVESPLLSTRNVGRAGRGSVCSSLAQGCVDVDEPGQGTREAPGLELGFSAPLQLWGCSQRNREG